MTKRNLPLRFPVRKRFVLPFSKRLDAGWNVVLPLIRGAVDVGLYGGGRWSVRWSARWCKCLPSSGLS